MPTGIHSFLIRWLISSYWAVDYRDVKLKDKMEYSYQIIPAIEMETEHSYSHKIFYIYLSHKLIRQKLIFWNFAILWKVTKYHWKWQFVTCYKRYKSWYCMYLIVIANCWINHTFISGKLLMLLYRYYNVCLIPLLSLPFSLKKLNHFRYPISNNSQKRIITTLSSINFESALLCAA